LEGQHGAAEESGQDHDGEAADPDLVHLNDDVVPVMRAAEDVTERSAGKYVKLLNGQKRLFQEIEQTELSPASSMLPYRQEFTRVTKGLTHTPGSSPDCGGFDAVFPGPE
jgi:hypothetical protein